LAGLLFMAASFAADPFVGLVGLVAVSAANLTALRVWHDRIRWELGLAGYNAVLLGLAAGYYLPHGRLVFLLAIVGGVVSALATEWLSHRLSKSELPVLGLPFLAFAWLVIAFAGTGHPPAHFARVDPLAALLPGFISSTLQVFGSAFFSKSVLSGLLVLAGLLFVSRISAAVGLGGALVATVLTMSRPVPELSINLIIVPIGLVFFIVPSRKMLWQLPAGIGLTVLLALALDIVVGVTHLPYLILPLTVTLFAALLLGRSKRLGVELVPMAMLRSPEDHFRVYLRRDRPRLHLPFFGTWYVSQGVDGGETHKNRLAHAWDFMVRDERGRSFATPGYRLGDYHAFGLLVCAPAAGKVVAIENGVADNAPGKLNREQNWGNHVIIEHSFLEYSILAHLQQGTVGVRVGEAVNQGTVVGRCGNSGYSGQPHLHYQLQAGPVPGSDALAAEFHNYLVLGDGRERLFRTGLPEQGQTVQPMVKAENVRRLLPAGFDGDVAFAVQRDSARVRQERWDVSKVEGESELTIVRSGPARVVLAEEKEGLSVGRVRGSRASLLARTFEGIEFIPFYSRPGLEFENGGWRHAFGRREPLGSGVDALVLESVGKGQERRIWFAEGVGIAKVEWTSGPRHIVGERQ
jgi:urea transporter